MPIPTIPTRSWSLPAGMLPACLISQQLWGVWHLAVASSVGNLYTVAWRWGHSHAQLLRCWNREYSIWYRTHIIVIMLCLQYCLIGFVHFILRELLKACVPSHSLLVFDRNPLIVPPRLLIMRGFMHSWIHACMQSPIGTHQCNFICLSFLFLRCLIYF